MTDVIVVGSGIAGLTAALHAEAGGCRVTLVTKDELEHANTRFAQGGVAAVLFDDDRVEDHIRDTLVAGAGLADPEAVRVLAAEGPDRIRELIALGVAFDRAADGTLAKGLEAAHSYPRVVHAGGDATGLAIEKALVARVRAAGIAVIEHAFLVDLLVDRSPSSARGRVAGVTLLVGGVRRTLEADAVVLATGGAGQLYRYTTNPEVATGDGIAAAIRAGAEVEDLEFVQFHPTVLIGKAPAAGLVGRGDPFLVSEAVRGEGATLIDEDGRRFVFDAHPDGELAPRDVVARAIAARIAEQDGRPVFLDATAIGADRLAARFPTIDAATRERGWDWSGEPIPVTPAAHYVMGGVATDLDGRTSVPGLFAVGEVARTGVHGANRLASNSLLEGAVFGARAGDAVAHAGHNRCPVPELVEGSSGEQRPRIAPDVRSHDTRRAIHDASTSSATDSGVARTDSGVARTDSGVAREDSEHGPFSREALQELMWADAGLVRDDAGLRRAASTIADWRAEARPRDTARDLEDDNLLLVAENVVAAALARTESVGAHYRSDAVSPSDARATQGAPQGISTAADTVPVRSRGVSRRRIPNLLHSAQTEEVA
ncbi:L-aspartate oxidase [Microbacterium sp. ASV49]|uniref:L-aspartate oxidase n=1 Tax=Microbacterium candidum TaxID=3041922 RepID=A0ABT7N2D5_9MICO|nr:L-aspartate oxidase [Microbacterium sp. ASV49]MDL9980831.1 L-aspartate oxidase [Microbacterium sp. ASV49]